jgi:transcriptional regulator with XRE-family HTH domain
VIARDCIAHDEKLTLRTLRLSKGLSQKELSTKLGTSQAAVSEYESRQRKPAEDMIRSLSESLEVDFNTLMEALANG